VCENSLYRAREDKPCRIRSARSASAGQPRAAGPVPPKTRQVYPNVSRSLVSRLPRGCWVCVRTHGIRQLSNTILKKSKVLAGLTRGNKGKSWPAAGARLALCKVPRRSAQCLSILVRRSERRFLRATPYQIQLFQGSFQRYVNLLRSARQ